MGPLNFSTRSRVIYAQAGRFSLFHCFFFPEHEKCCISYIIDGEIYNKYKELEEIFQNSCIYCIFLKYLLRLKINIFKREEIINKSLFFNFLVQKKKKERSLAHRGFLKKRKKEEREKIVAERIRDDGELRVLNRESCSTGALSP